MSRNITVMAHNRLTKPRSMTAVLQLLLVLAAFGSGVNVFSQNIYIYRSNKVGGESGAQAIVLVSYGCLQGQARTQLRLVDCATAENYWSATGVGASELELFDALLNDLRSH